MWGLLRMRFTGNVTLEGATKNASRHLIKITGLRLIHANFVSWNNIVL